MRVALDTNGRYTTEAGVARYIRGLLNGFKQLALPGLSIREFAWTVENLGYQQPQRALKTLYRELIWIKLIGPRLLKREGVDLFHSTVGCQVIPPARIKHVATLHDLAVFRNPERFRRWQGRSGRACLTKIARADRIICISRFTADEAIAVLGLSAGKIEVVHNGCAFHPSEPLPSEQKPPREVPDEFFLFVGSLEPGKNLALMREVYRQAVESGHRLPPLLIVGARWEGVADEGQPPGDWHYFGRQSDDVLVYLYRRALALVFPSKYEGFGLPVAEAMALGCPVICSPVASMPEVGGEAAWFCELQPSAYGNAMRQLAGNEILRHELKEKGHRQAQKFSWKTCAEQTSKVYRQVLAS